MATRGPRFASDRKPQARWLSKTSAPLKCQVPGKPLSGLPAWRGVAALGSQTPGLPQGTAAPLAMQLCGLSWAGLLMGRWQARLPDLLISFPPSPGIDPGLSGTRGDDLVEPPVPGSPIPHGQPWKQQRFIPEEIKRFAFLTGSEPFRDAIPAGLPGMPGRQMVEPCPAFATKTNSPPPPRFSGPRWHQPHFPGGPNAHGGLVYSCVCTRLRPARCLSAALKYGRTFREHW